MDKVFLSASPSYQYSPSDETNSISSARSSALANTRPASTPVLFTYSDPEVFSRNLHQRDANTTVLETRVRMLQTENLKLKIENQNLTNAGIDLDGKIEIEKRKSAKLASQIEILQESAINIEHKLNKVIRSQRENIVNFLKKFENSLQDLLQFISTQNDQTKLIQQIQQRLQDLKEEVKAIGIAGH